MGRTNQRVARTVWQGGMVRKTRRSESDDKGCILLGENANMGTRLEPVRVAGFTDELELFVTWQGDFGCRSRRIRDCGSGERFWEYV